MTSILELSIFSRAVRLRWPLELESQGAIISPFAWLLLMLCPRYLIPPSPPRDMFRETFRSTVEHTAPHDGFYMISDLLAKVTRSVTLFTRCPIPGIPYINFRVTPRPAHRQESRTEICSYRAAYRKVNAALRCYTSRPQRFHWHNFCEPLMAITPQPALKFSVA